MVIQQMPLVSTIAVGLGVAFVMGLISSKLRVPPIVGYLLTGILLGPLTPGYVADLHVAEQLAEIGIVMLMFGVGLHFSLKDLMEVRRIALPGAIGQIAIAIAMGTGLAWYWGWSIVSGLTFGLAMSVASTVVLIRALEEHNLLQSVNGRIAIGWLIVEDLAMVLALVLVPALAVSELDKGSSHAITGMLIAIGKVLMFAAIMLIAGKRFLPWLLALVARTRSRELFTLAVFSAAVGVAFISAVLFDVSFALGAFFAGMMIRESDLNHEVADRALPFQDAFAVLFFVAVGMLFEPQILLEEPLKVLATVGVIMLGKSVVAFLIVMLSRYPLKTGLLVSASLAQIGEFSFILVTLGIVYGLLPEEARSLILAGAIISIALNPLMFYLSRVVFDATGRNGKLSKIFDMRDDDLAHLDNAEKRALKDLIILVGYGRVGRYVCEHVQESHFDLVVVDTNRERVELLREHGFHALVGDATHTETLNEAALAKAVAIIVCVPDPFEARRIVETARAAKPSIKVIVRAHNDEEMYYFQQQKVDFAPTGPREISRSIVSYLHHMKNNKKRR